MSPWNLISNVQQFVHVVPDFTIVVLTLSTVIIIFGRCFRVALRAILAMTLAGRSLGNKSARGSSKCVNTWSFISLLCLLVDFSKSQYCGHSLPFCLALRIIFCSCFLERFCLMRIGVCCNPVSSPSLNHPPSSSFLNECHKIGCSYSYKTFIQCWCQSGYDCRD